MKGPARAISTVGPQEIRLTLPQGFRAAKAFTLSGGREVSLRKEGADIVATVPQVSEYEVLALTRTV
jgi:hypothetical protein